MNKQVNHECIVFFLFLLKNYSYYYEKTALPVAE
jgi:hypothetical protein